MQRSSEAASGPDVAAQPLPWPSAALDDASPAAFAARVAAVVLASYVPVLVTAATSAAVGWATVLVVGAPLGLLVRRWGPEVGIGGLLAAAVLISSWLVQDASQYMPAVAAGTALGIGSGIRLAERRLPPAPAAAPGLVLAAIAAYLAWAAVTTVSSTAWRVSLVYLFGMALVLGLAFALAPRWLTSVARRRRTLAVLVAIGIVSAAVTGATAVLGPVAVFRGRYGEALLLELTLARHPTGLVVPWVSGLYRAQGSQYQALVVALVAALALRAESDPRWSRWWTLAALALVPAAVLTLSRAGWLMAAVACGLVGLAQLWRRRPDGLSLAIGALFAALALALLTNLLGANARFDLQAARGWASVTATTQPSDGEPQPVVGVHGNVDVSAVGAQVRGGTDLSSRAVLWVASASAVQARPVTGYGPGLDAAAIAPFIKSSYASYRGITSHSTWLRTAVEMGLPGLALLVLVWLAVAVTVLRGWSGGSPPEDATLPALAAMAVALLIDQSVETYLLGGLTFANVVWAVALGLLAWSAQPRGTGRVAGLAGPRPSPAIRASHTSTAADHP